MSTILQKLLTQCSSIVLLLALVVNGRPKCEISDAYANECGKKLMFISPDEVHLPNDDTELKTRCADIDEGLKCLKKYSKSCLDPFATQMMNLVVKNGDKLEAKYCKNDSERLKLLKSFQCAKDADLSPIKLCIAKFVVQAEHLADVPGDHRIPAACCSFQMLKKCIQDKSVGLCNQPDKVNYITNFLTELTSDVVKTGCGRFDSLTHCNSAMDKKEWEKLKELVSSDNMDVILAKRVDSSPFMALKHIMKHLIEE
ncbi:uncharacterized protein LOC128958237 [Oppia nitens]|uniref:uncharacterized protein LOC128958237 n=1 Tax=Oppia nitens TaxID=1686743 RepID=UPI0023DCD0FD|nr:uncharacterized protein LOC128958237 [Oppia nitens]